MKAISDFWRLKLEKTSFKVVLSFQHQKLSKILHFKPQPNKIKHLTPFWANRLLHHLRAHLWSQQHIETSQKFIVLLFFRSFINVIYVHNITIFIILYLRWRKLYNKKFCLSFIFLRSKLLQNLYVCNNTVVVCGVCFV